MRSLFGICLSGAVLALALGCGKKDNTASGGGTANIDGTYAITGLEMGGEKLPDEFISKGPEGEQTVKIAGDKMTMMTKKKDDTNTIKIDSSKSPAEINITETRDGKSKTSYGIYKLEGDTLSICATVDDEATEKDRPKEFKTSKESKTVLMTLKKK